MYARFKANTKSQEFSKVSQNILCVEMKKLSKFITFHFFSNSYSYSQK